MKIKIRSYRSVSPFLQAKFSVRCSWHTLLWAGWPSCQCRRHRFNPWVWKIPWRRKWQPTPVSLPGESHGQRSLEGCGPWGSQRGTTEWLSRQVVRMWGQGETVVWWQNLRRACWRLAETRRVRRGAEDKGGAPAQAGAAQKGIFGKAQGREGRGGSQGQNVNANTETRVASRPPGWTGPLSAPDAHDEVPGGLGAPTSGPCRPWRQGPGLEGPRLGGARSRSAACPASRARTGLRRDRRGWCRQGRKCWPQPWAAWVCSIEAHGVQEEDPGGHPRSTEPLTGGGHCSQRWVSGIAQQAPGLWGNGRQSEVQSGWPSQNPVLFHDFHLVAENRALKTIPPITGHGNKPRTNETLSWAELLSLLRSEDMFGHLPGPPLMGSGCFTKVGEFPKLGFKLASWDGLAGRRTLSS